MTYNGSLIVQSSSLEMLANVSGGVQRKGDVIRIGPVRPVCLL